MSTVGTKYKPVTLKPLDANQQQYFGKVNDIVTNYLSYYLSDNGAVFFQKIQIQPEDKRHE